MGETFTKSCRLWQIVNEIALAFYSPHGAYDFGPDQSSLEFAEAKYQQLLHLADGLGDDQTGWNETSHHENVFRINYHSAIMDVFQPFLNTSDSLKTFGSDKSKPADVFWASVRQLRQIVLYHPLVHSSAAYSIFWHTGLLHVINASLEAPTHPQAQFFFLVCLISYHKMSASFPITTSIIQGLLGAGVAKGIITNAAARYIQERFQHNSMRVSMLEGSFVLDFGLALKNPRSSHAAELARQFESMAVSTHRPGADQNTSRTEGSRYRRKIEEET